MTVYTSSHSMQLITEPLIYNWDYTYGSKLIAHSEILMNQMTNSRFHERDIFNNRNTTPDDIFPNWNDTDIHLWITENVCNLHVDMEYMYRIDRDSIVCELKIRGDVPEHLIDDYRQHLVMFKLSHL